MIVDGRLSQRRWEAEDGSKRSKHEVVGQNVRFMPRRDGTRQASAGSAGSAEGGASPRGNASEMGPPDFTDDDIPF